MTFFLTTILILLSFNYSNASCELCSASNSRIVINDTPDDYQLRDPDMYDILRELNIEPIVELSDIVNLHEIDRYMLFGGYIKSGNAAPVFITPYYKSLLWNIYIYFYFNGALPQTVDEVTMHDCLTRLDLDPANIFSDLERTQFGIGPARVNPTKFEPGDMQIILLNIEQRNTFISQLRNDPINYTRLIGPVSIGVIDKTFLSIPIENIQVLYWRLYGSSSFIAEGLYLEPLDWSIPR